MQTHDYDLKEPWYLKNGTLLTISFLAIFVQVIAIFLIPLLILKKKNISKHCRAIKGYIQDALQQLSDERDQLNQERDGIIRDAKAKAEQLEAESNQRLAVISQKIENKDAIYEEIVKDATKEAELRTVELTNQLHTINAEIEKKDFYMSEINRLKEEIEALNKKESSRQEKIDHLMSIQKSVNHAIKKYFKEDALERDHELTLPANLIREIDTLAPSITLKLHCMDYKDLRRAFRANNKIINETLARYESRYTTKTNRAIYQLMVLGLRAELQNVLYTLTYSKLNDGIAAIEDLINKYLNIARDGSQTIASTLAKFIGELEPLFVDAVKIEYEYYVKKEAARQEQLELRAQMREEAEERKRLKEQQEQMKKEEEKYHSEIDNIHQQLTTTSDDEQKQKLLDKIKELESQLSDLSSKKEEITSLQNGKAGYVYVISNLGSFGNDVFKVGMTRRLDPQERIDELGNASVPFKFDVHSFIFSQDAVQLESDLHAALESKRVNKVNPRKEFFKVSLDDLEKLVEKYDPTAEFNRTMQAEQYYQSLSMAEENQEKSSDSSTVN
ncbi:GIY-YIG nuclease family protein [Mitsuokella jalaludinii]|uniref:GIY-YIG nuclease family protein n=1 Tax=Mitsuokella jalaludinii TaxID=187979 RepID=UPI00307C3A6E